jgi:hypothetical protein
MPEWPSGNALDLLFGARCIPLGAEKQLRGSFLV